MKKQTDISKKLYQVLSKVYEFEKQQKHNKKPTLKIYDRSGVIYNLNIVFMNIIILKI